MSRKEKVKLADKPGSVGHPQVPGSHSSRRRVTTALKQPTREQREPRLMLPYLALLQMGFTLPSVSPQPRWALTPSQLAPTRSDLRRSTVSPLPDLQRLRAKAIGGLLSVALSVAFALRLIAPGR